MICLSIDYLSVPQHIEISQRFGAENKIISRGHFNKQSFGFGLKSLVWTAGRTRIMATVAMPSREREAIMLTSGASGRINALLSLRLWKSLFMVINAFVLLLFLPFRRRRVAFPASVSVAGNQGGVGRCCSIAGVSGNGKDEESMEKKGMAVVRMPASMVPARKSALAVAVVDKEVAARRALAIKRVLEDDDKDSIREYLLFDTQRGVTLFTQSWTPANIKVRGVVVLLHGLNEHSGRYNDFAKQLNANGYKVYGMDWIVETHLKPVIGEALVSISIRIPDHILSMYLGSQRKQPLCIIIRVRLRTSDPLTTTWSGYRFVADFYVNILFLDGDGHGGSDGLHAYVHSLDDAVCDMKLFIRKVATENPGLQCFCFGHSTGGAIILKAALDPEVEACIAGVVLTSPAVGVQPSHPIFAVLAPVFAFLLPRYQLSAANKRGSVVSRDPEALIAKYSDPLVFTGSIRIRTGYEILRITSYLQQNLKNLKVPFLVLHGTSDSVTDPEATQKLYIEAASSDKSIRLLDGLLHDLLFEPERQEIIEDIIQWLNQRL